MKKEKKRTHFTDQYLRAIQPGSKRAEYYDDHLIKDEKLKKQGVPGLGIRVSPGGSKTFFFTYWYANNSKRITIGTYPAISLDYARGKATNYAETVAEGKDPNRIRQKSKTDRPVTLREYADRFQREYVERKLKASTQSDYKARLNHIRGSKIANIPLADITRDQVRGYLKRESVSHPINANRIHSILSKLFNEAMEDQLIPENPIKGMKKVSKENSRDVRYSEKDIKEIWELIHDEPESMQGLVKMLLITGQRLGETSRMKWEYIDLDYAIWTIPKAETKADRAHIVPLSAMALQVLRRMKACYPESVYVFPGIMKKDRPISDVKGVTERIRAKVPGFRIHDLRHIVATGMIDLGIEFIHVGKVLNHKALAGENHITARYANSEFTDQKRRAMDTWSAHLTGLFSPLKLVKTANQVG